VIAAGALLTAPLVGPLIAGAGGLLWPRINENEKFAKLFG
jgi:hypothetical protein